MRIAVTILDLPWTSIGLRDRSYYLTIDPFEYRRSDRRADLRFHGGSASTVGRALFKY